MDRTRQRSACLPASLVLVLVGALLFWAEPSSAGVLPPAIKVTTAQDELNEDGDCSLREAIQAANTDAPVDACAAGIVGSVDDIGIPLRSAGQVLGAIRLTREVVDQDDDANQIGDLDVAGPTMIRALSYWSDVEIDGRARAGNATYHAKTCDQLAAMQVGNNSRIFHVLPDASLNLRELSILGGYAGGADEAAGGGILNEGTLSIVESEVFANFAVAEPGQASDAMGGGLAEMPSGRTTVSRTSFRLNGVLASATASGGGAYFGAPMDDREVTQGWFRNNLVCGDVARGGGVAHLGETAFRDSLFEKNIAEGVTETQGGGLANLGDSSVRVIESNPYDNSARGAAQNLGAGLYNEGEMSLESTGVLENKSPTGNGFGTGIYNAGSLEITRSAVLHNGDVLDQGSHPAAAGGGVYSVGSLFAYNSTILENRADRGAGLFVAPTGDVELLNVTLFANDADESGGGLAVEADGSATIEHSIVAYSRNGDCVEAEDDGVVSVAYNLDSDGSCGLDSVGDLSNTPPGLTLECYWRCYDNGGYQQDSVRAMVPRLGSPVIDAIPMDAEHGCPPTYTDQRGVNRPVDGDGDGDARCDIGAAERKDSDPVGLCEGFEDDTRHQVVDRWSERREPLRGTFTDDIFCAGWGGQVGDAIDGREGDDLIFGDYNYSASQIAGGPGDDVIWAFDSKDEVRGGAGADVIRGGNDNDRLFGGLGADLIIGGRGKDYMVGNPGNDELFGGAGFDALFGGPDVDRCVAGDGGASKRTCEGA